MKLHLQPEWVRTLGQYVEIRRSGETVRKGMVEAVMPDSSIVWISAEGAQPRQMVEKADGSEIYAGYPWDKLSTRNKGARRSNKNASDNGWG